MKQFYLNFLLLFVLNFANAHNSKLAGLTGTISGDATVCQNDSGVNITFTGSGGTAPYTFTYTINGISSPPVTTTSGNSITVTVVTSAVGSFTYELTNVKDDANDSKNLSDKAVIVVNGAPTVDFTFSNNQCSGSNTAFTSSVSGGKLPYSYSWDFGDGTSSNQQNPTHIFTSLGCGTQSFTVKLTVGAGGCSITKTHTVTVKQKPDIDFTDQDNPFNAFNNCANASSNPVFTINVVNSSVSTCIVSYSINWGDGNTQNNATFPASHTYNAIGAYNMVITALGNNGCNNSKTYVIKNVSNPLGGLNSPGSTQNLCAPTQNLQFSISNWGTNSSDTTYTVDYGDNTSVLVLTQAQLVGSSYYNSADPASSINYPIPHVYSKTSCPNPSFEVKLDVKNACGTTPFTLGNISILIKPDANFTAPQKGCLNTSILFTNTTISGYGQNCSQGAIYTWDFGDGTPVITTGITSPQNINHTFASPGTYTVTLKAQNFCGTTSKTQQICIEPSIVPQFTLNTISGCSPVTVTTINSTNITNSCTLPTYTWSVSYTAANCGTGPVSFPNQTTPNATYNFTEPGTYTITLTANSACGSPTATQTVTVKKPPIATIATIPDYCGTASITPTIATINSCTPASTLTYAWSFPGGTPATANTANPGTINYAVSGNYTVSLVVTNECGASATATKSFSVNPSPIITNTSLSQTICSGLPTTLVTLTTSPAGANIAWSATATAGISGFIPSGNTNTIPVQTITTTNTSSGTVTYAITPSIGSCLGPKVNYVVTVNPSPTFTTQPVSSTVCMGGTPTLLSIALSSTSITPTYQWYSNTANSTTGGTLITGATNNTFNPPVNSVGTLYYYCIVSLSSGGCSSLTSNIAAVTVTAPPTISIQPMTTQSICVGGIIPALTVAYTGGTGTPTYQWYSNTTNSSTGGTLIPGATSSGYTPPAYAAVGTFYYYTTISLSGSGCGSTTSSTAEVKVLADPTITSQPLGTQTQCQGSAATTLTVVATGGIGTFNYQWYSNTANNTTSGTLISGATMDNYTPPTTTVGTKYYYCVITQAGLGCGVVSNVSTVVVVAAPAITTQPLATQSVCLNGSTTALTIGYTNGTGTPSYQWYSNANNSNVGGTLLAGATAITYTPLSTAIGTTYYYCEISFSSGGCSKIVSNAATVVVTALPTISAQPMTTQNICVGGIIPALTVAYTGGTGIATYQWYRNTSNSSTGGSLIPGATSSSFTPPAFAAVGSFYYYAVVSLNGNGCGDAVSAAAEVIVSADPTLTTQPLNTQTQCQGSPSTTLTVVATGGIGTYNYQWYSNTTNNTTSGTAILGATADNYTPPTTIVGTLYYYCIITQAGLGCSVTSSVSTVIVVPAPIITTQPQSSSVCEGGVPTTLTVAYSNGAGTASYQWYSNLSNDITSGTLIFGATLASYTPPSTPVGTVYYYCIITFSSGGCSSISSNTATVTVNVLPTISTHPMTTQSICVGGIIPALTVAYTGGTGTPTYQWFSNATNSTTGGSSIPGATSSSYTPPAYAAVGTFYYYATISLSGSGCGSTTSTTAEVKVLADPTITSQPIGTQTQCQGSAATALTVVAIGGIGTFNYQWYSNTANNTSSGTVITGASSNTYTPPTTTVGTQYYYCVITQAGLGCGVVSNVSTVVIVAAPAITTQPLATQSVCLNGATTPLTLAYTNGTGTPTYQWYSNVSNSNVGGTLIAGATATTYTPLSTGVGTTYYYCEITFSSGGCSLISSATAEVNVYQIPVITNQKLILCSGDTLNFSPQQGNGNTVPSNTLYTWGLPVINPVGSISGATSQTVPQNSFIQTLVNNTNQVVVATYTLTPIAGICTGNTFTIEVSVYPKPQVIFSSQNQTICNNTSSAAINLYSSTPGTITFSWTANVPSEISGAVVSGTDSIPVQNLSNSSNHPSTITYTAIATFNYNGSNCNGPASIYSITVNSSIVASGIISSYNGYGVSYFGATDGAIDVTVSGGSGNYSYNWIGPNNFTATTQDITGVPAGTYTVTINDGYCSPVVLTFVLTQPPELLFQEDASVHVNLICFGDSNGSLGVTITQESISPYDFQLINSNGTIVKTILDNPNLNQVFTGLVSDIYSIKITDANGGTKILSGIKISQPSDIVITAVTTPITCYDANDASITLTVTGGTSPYQAQWDNLATGFYQGNLAAGDYSITVTDANNCKKVITVNIPQAPVFKVDPVVKNISCFGAHDGSIALNFVGGIPPVKLTWSDGSTSGTTRNNLGPGTYSVVITDSKPCTISKTFTILEPQKLTLSYNITNAFDCDDANSGAINLLVSGGSAPFTYSWSNGATTEDLVNIPAGNYNVTVTDANGCTITGQYSIKRQPPIVIKVDTKTDFNCETLYVKQSFIAKVSGGIPPYTLLWSSGEVSGPNNEIMQTETNGTVVLEVTDSYGCKANYTFTVDIPELDTADFTGTSYGYSHYGIYSIKDPIQFTTTSTGDFISVLWDFGDGTFSSEINPIHTYINPKDYVVTQTVTYPFGCLYVAKITLVVEKGYVLVTPTAFTPNNDNLNDTFRPVTKNLKNVRLDIYDTWGSLVYSETGDVLRGWDAKIKGQNAENGNYNCTVSAETFYGTIINEKRTFVLIK